MKRQVGTGVAIAAIVALGVFAGIGNSAEKKGYEPFIDREVVKLEIQPATAADRRAADRQLQLRGKRRKGPKVKYFVAKGSRTIGALETSQVGIMACPRRFKAIAGYYKTSGGIVADWFTRSGNSRRWEYAFINLLDEEGEVQEGVVCMSKV